MTFQEDIDFIVRETKQPNNFERTNALYLFAKGLDDKLTRAMAVVEECLSRQDGEGGECIFCMFGKWYSEHRDCPLVAQGFLDKEGNRL